MIAVGVYAPYYSADTENFVFLRPKYYTYEIPHFTIRNGLRLCAGLLWQ